MHRDHAARKRLDGNLFDLYVAIHTFLEGEVSNGLISPFKMPLLLHLKMTKAVVDQARRDLVTDTTDI